MQFQEVRYFIALSETLNFTRAAEVCNVSQPALTRAIKALEDKLGGGPLIHRERGNTHLTEFGRIMLPYFATVIAQLEAAQLKARSYAKLADAALGVGLLCTIGPARLVSLFAGFARRHPQIDIRLEDGSADDIEERLIAGDINLAISARPEQLDPRLHGIPLFRERFVVALAPDDALAARPVVRMRDLNRRRYLGRANCEFYQQLRDIRQRLGGIEFQRPYTSGRDDWIQNMVLAGLGFTYIPEYAVALPGLAIRPLVEPEVVRLVQLVTVRGRPHSPAVGAFVHAARRQPWDGKVDAPAARVPARADA
ncbi:LysR family transcriptional regulator [Rhodobacteraceae bacterium 2CG4]|uniref:LysR family transcriptional regulator n=1 Tax=Halovulum marinum TaxID=2662447 RepID=A0A6L5YX70_9RHOB|nr:LysR family transcriptional regulator [Halovulum marinum]MSU88452.1 LysR family transcriptional regulator [Halovulum marinum]